MYSLITIFIVLVIILIVLFSFSLKKKIKNSVEISGVVYNKITEKGIQGAKVYLGELTSTGKTHNFTKETKYTTVTNEEGIYKFEDVEQKNYWVMAEYNGKKALKMVNTQNYNIVDEVNLMF